MGKKILMPGGTGYIGRALASFLNNAGYSIIILSRDPEKYKTYFPAEIRIARWSGKCPEGWHEFVEQAFAIINLSGENIASGRWSILKKDRILTSRLLSTNAVVQAVNKAIHKPRVVIQASAAGYYGSRGNEILTEESPPGNGFLSDVCLRWENALKEINSDSVRTVFLRTGVVLSRESAFIKKVITPFMLFLGGRIGGKEQWMSWIHLEDEMRAIKFLLEKETAKGAFNLTSPSPVTNDSFYKQLASSLNRPCWMTAPKIILKLLAGEMANEVILASQRIIPQKLLDAGFDFTYDNTKAALKKIFE